MDHDEEIRAARAAEEASRAAGVTIYTRNGDKIGTWPGATTAEALGQAASVGAYLSGANLCRADLRDADLSGAYLSGAYLGGAYLRGANLSGADLSGADLSGANLCRADLRDADLSGADLCRADLRDADLSDADLSGADLCGADLRGANGVIAIDSEHPWRLVAVSHTDGPRIHCGCRSFASIFAAREHWRDRTDRQYMGAHLDAIKAIARSLEWPQ